MGKGAAPTGRLRTPYHCRGQQVRHGEQKGCTAREGRRLREINGSRTL